jgi:hypothetical protein
MKFIRYSAFLIALTCGVTQPLLAKSDVREVVGNTIREAVREANGEDETFSTLLKFAAIAIVSGGVHVGAKTFQLSAATQAYAHAANVLLQLGYIADKPALSKLGVKAILAGLAQRAGTSDIMLKNILPNVPFVGESLSQAGVQGSAAATIAVYEVLARFYGAMTNVLTNIANEKKSDKKEL